MNYSDKAVRTVKKNIEKQCFEQNGGFYLDYESPVCKQVFKNWDNDMAKLSQFQKTPQFLMSYETHLAKRIAKNNNKK